MSAGFFALLSCIASSTALQSARLVILLSCAAFAAAMAACGGSDEAEAGTGDADGFPGYSSADAVEEGDGLEATDADGSLGGGPADSDSSGPSGEGNADGAATADAGDAWGDAGLDGPEAALEATVEAYCPGYAERFCTAAESCGCTAIPGFPESCKGAFQAACRAILESYLPDARAGSAQFAPEAAMPCFEALEEAFAACVPLADDVFFVACPVVEWADDPKELPGEDAPCQWMCAAGLRCSSKGICVVPGEVGATCASPEDCAVTLVCEAGTCQAPNHAATGTSCAPQDTCGGDTKCMASVRKVCEAKPPGGPCQWDEDCPAGEFCPGNAGEADRTCAAAPGNGELCGNGIACASGYACSAGTGQCAPLPEAGATCALDRLGPFVCAGGLACEDGVCGPPPVLGEPCANGAVACADGLGCAFEEDGSFCRERAGDGAPCQNDQTCKDGYFCDFSENACTLVLETGAPCSSGNECGPNGACLPDEAFVFRCAPRPGLGDACYIGDCQEGLACRSPYDTGSCAPAICKVLRF